MEDTHSQHDLLSLFSGGKDGRKFERIQTRAPTIYSPSEASFTTQPTWEVPRTQLHTGTDYVRKYIEKENEELLKAAKEVSAEKVTPNIDMVSVGTVPTHIEMGSSKCNEVYSEFNFNHRPKIALPILEYKKEIIDHIRAHNVTVIQGNTGCGKSTQVPQFILDSCRDIKAPCNIIVTQPRRIAALSIANRVSDERHWQLGTVIGVQVGMYKKMSEKTLLTYCTTGVLLRKLVQAKNMTDFTHVIVDEVHERDQEMDFLLLVIRKLLRSNSRQVKVVLMSATFDVDKFSHYFSDPTAEGFIPAPIINIPKKRSHKVDIYYLDEIKKLGPIPEINPSEPRVDLKMREFCGTLIRIFDALDVNENDEDEEGLEEEACQRPAVLVFLPGIYEIEEMHAMLAGDKDQCKWDIVALHSSITNEEQSRIFESPPTGYRRIILSTNIAESSITIDNVKFVIDLCLTKQLITDPATNFQCLELCWASKANCEQRAGRAGRVMNGRVYRMVPKEFYEKLANEGAPEISRCPLENLVLNTKILDLGEPKAILALAIDPPDISNLERTILLLKEAGGLIGMINNSFDGILTDLGRIMAALPLEIHVSKLLALGNIFNVLKEAIIISACMTVKSIFSNPLRDKTTAYQKKIEWADSCMSDQLAYLNAYQIWKSHLSRNRFKMRSPGERSWCKQNYLQVRALHEVDHLVFELTKRLESLGIQEAMGENKIVLNSRDKAFNLRVVIAGAFYPNYFVRSAGKASNDLSYGVRELGGGDPRRTVCLLGWRHEHPGRLYARRIQDLFKGVVPNAERSIVEFDNSSRVYVTFDDDESSYENGDKFRIPGKVSVSVYKALKFGKLQGLPSIPVLDPKVSQQRAKALGLALTNTMFFNKENFKQIRDIATPFLPKLPPIVGPEGYMNIHIISFENPHKFWVRLLDRETKYQFTGVENFCAEPDTRFVASFNDKDMPDVGTLVLAFRDRSQYARAIVECLTSSRAGTVATVRFVDYGGKERVPVTQLMRFLKPHPVALLPGLAFQATMTGIEPSKRLTNSDWEPGAKELVDRYLENVQNWFIKAKVFSVVNSVVSMQLIATDRSNHVIDLNDLLIKEGFAVKAAESYYSVYNNKMREQMNLQSKGCKRDPDHLRYLELMQHDKKYFRINYPDPPKAEECKNWITLKGPISPFEVTLQSLAVVAASKKVKVEPNSVNSILMDANPDDPHERLLVAGTVSQNTAGTALSLRNTTLMPNVPGLTALLCLIFAPKIELRRSTNGTHLIGALCGLGYNKYTRSALLPEHDMEVYFDTEFNLEDLQNINILRHIMSIGISVKKDDEAIDITDIQSKAIETLKKLTSADKRTKIIARENLVDFTHWHLYSSSLLRAPMVNDEFMLNYIYPLHEALQTEDRNEEAEEMARHVKELRNMAQSDPKLSEKINAVCKLCNELIICKQSLRVHLYSEIHKEREFQAGLRKDYKTY